MTRRCILHVGINKTGTTSIQNSFQGFDDGRLRYADLQRANHSRPLQMLFAAAYRDLADEQLSPTLFARLSRDSLRKGFQAQLEDRSRDLLISAENLSTAFTSHDIADIVAHLRPHFDRIEALAYLREPLGFMVSSLQQRLRDRYVPLRADRLYPAYRTRLGPWDDALGQGNVTLALFDPGAFAGGNVLQDFSSRIGVTCPHSGKQGANQSLTADNFALLYAFRRAQHDKGVVPDLARERPAVRDLMRLNAAPFAFDPTLWGDVLERQADDIAWAETRMERVFPTPRPPATDAVVFTSEDDVLDHAATVRRRALAWARWRTIPFSAPARMVSRLISAHP